MSSPFGWMSPNAPEGLTARGEGLAFTACGHYGAGGLAIDFDVNLCHALFAVPQHGLSPLKTELATDRRAGLSPTTRQQFNR
jgi:hypothetical protein